MDKKWGKRVADRLADSPTGSSFRSIYIYSLQGKKNKSESFSKESHKAFSCEKQKKSSAYSKVLKTKLSGTSKNQRIKCKRQELLGRGELYMRKSHARLKLRKRWRNFELNKLRVRWSF